MSYIFQLCKSTKGVFVIGLSQKLVSLFYQKTWWKPDLPVPKDYKHKPVFFGVHCNSHGQDSSCGRATSSLEICLISYGNIFEENN